MNNNFGVVIAVFACIILAWGLYSIARLIFIKHNGSEITAKVLRVDTNCDRYNKIEVGYEGKIYPVTISRSDCHDGVYKVGQTVTLIMWKGDETLVWPKAKYEWLPFIILAILALGYYTTRDRIAKSTKPRSNY